MTTAAGRRLLDLLHELLPGSHYSALIAAIEAEAAAHAVSEALAKVRQLIATLPGSRQHGLNGHVTLVNVAAVLAILDVASDGGGGR